MLNHSINAAKHAKMYKEEVSKNHRFGCGIMVVLLLRGIRIFVSTFMGASSTILVVYIFKVCARCFNCVQAADVNGGEPFLSFAPSITCYTGWHRVLAVVLDTLLPFFFLALLPYAAVLGDVDYVQRKTICSPKAWSDNAVRKATLIDQGAAHPFPNAVLHTRVVELVCTIALPCISILATPWPTLLTGVVAAIGALMFVNSLVWPPLVNPTWCAIVQGSKLFALLAMICGFLTVVAPSDMRDNVTLLLLPAAVLDVAFIVCKIWCTKKAAAGVGATGPTKMGSYSAVAPAGDRLDVEASELRTLNPNESPSHRRTASAYLALKAKE